MFSKKAITGILIIIVLFPITAFAEKAEQNAVTNNFNDLLHYLTIGRLDLAKATATELLKANPDPVYLFNLAGDNPQSTTVLQKAAENEFDSELAELCSKVIAVVEKGRFVLRRDPKVIVEAIGRLNSTPRAQLAATKSLQDAGEYAIPFMIDVLTDPARREEQPNVILTLPKIGRDAIRPLAAALQMNDLTVKISIIDALGKIAYPQTLPYLKYEAETDKSEQVRQAATQAITKIDPQSLQTPAGQLFYRLAQDYYYHMESLAPAADANFANVWFWNADKKSLERVEVDKRYFHELMSMRCCEWGLKADASLGQAIGLWIAAFFKAESTGVAMPGYFGPTHSNAFVYATTAGPEYLHQALERALKDNDSYVALAAIEALIKTAGEKSMLYRLGLAQPLLQALSNNDKRIAYSAAIAIATVSPTQDFAESSLVIRNLVEAIKPLEDANGKSLTTQLADSYALRSLEAMIKLRATRNTVINLAAAQEQLIQANKDSRQQVRILSCQALAYINSPAAQRAIAAAGLNTSNPMPVQIAAFNSLADSAKINANLLDDKTIDDLYALISSAGTPPELKAAAASAFGALNLPSTKVKDLIIGQAKS
jgi:HEAT repeat protein